MVFRLVVLLAAETMVVVREWVEQAEHAPLVRV
jgi:hypothetical protein